jgi:hypothetical protein
MCVYEISNAIICSILRNIVHLKFNHMYMYAINHYWKISLVCVIEHDHCCFKYLLRFFFFSTFFFIASQGSDSKQHLASFFPFFGGTGVWTQALTFARQTLELPEPLQKPFCVGFFDKGHPKLFAWGWFWTIILLISVSWVARITGMVPGLNNA